MSARWYPTGRRQFPSRDALDVPAITAPVRFDATGTPIVDGLETDHIELNGDVYMRRFYLQRSKQMSVRVHHILRSDAGIDLHDHPWDFTSYVLKGAYTEITPEGETRYEAPCILTRSAESLHRLVLDEGDVWTYVVTGAVRRPWGFQTPTCWVHWSDYDQSAR